MDDDAALIAFFKVTAGEILSPSAGGGELLPAAAPPSEPGGFQPDHGRPGVNAPKVVQYATDEDPTDHGGVDGSMHVYGTTDTILADLNALGVDFFRQPVGADLGWPRSLEQPNLPVPRIEEDGSGPASGGDAMYVAIFGVVDPTTRVPDETSGSQPGREAKTNLLTLLNSLASSFTPGYPQKVVLSLLSSGDNTFDGEDTSGQYPPTRGPRALTWAPEHDAATSSVSWWDGTPAYMNQYVSADTLDFSPTAIASYDVTVTDPADEADPGNVNRAWCQGTLDLRSPYKLKYLYYIGYAYGRLLLEVNDTSVSQGHGEIWEKIYALEVFNEVNGSNQFFSRDDAVVTGYLSADALVILAHARFWSLAVREFVRGFQHALSAAFVDDDGVPRKLTLWLPSLLSYKDIPSRQEVTDGEEIRTGDAPTFASVLWFQRCLCSFLVPDFAHDAVTPGVDFTWFQNQDYHYYNYKEDHAPGPILRLAAELEELRMTFTGANSDGESIVSIAGHGVTISVCETGAAADPGINSRNIADTAFPYLARPRGSPTITVDRFQAREVWRRLSVAATGARHVAWHTHMSFVTDRAGETDGFKYMGLRQDYDPTMSNLTDPNTVVQRLSWWAYQRFASLRSDSTVPPPFSNQLLARLVNDLPPTTDGYVRDVDLTSLDYVGIAVHFLRNPEEHWYLLLIDPTAAYPFKDPANPATDAIVTATLETLGDVHADFDQWPTIPGDETSTYTPISTADTDPPSGAGALPILDPPADATWVPTRITSGRSCQVYLSNPATGLKAPDLDPILIHCTAPCRITWAVTS